MDQDPGMESSDFNVCFLTFSSFRKCLHNSVKTQMCLGMNHILAPFVAATWITGHQNWWCWKLKYETLFSV